MPQERKKREHFILGRWKRLFEEESENTNRREYKIRNLKLTREVIESHLEEA